MFRTLLTRPLRLDVGNRTVTFNTLSDFEFSLASRSEVPAGKIAELVGLPMHALQREARSIRRMERTYVDVLSQSIQAPGSIGALIHELDTQSFSNDHEWRAIMTSLKQQPPRFNEFKQVALVKYMQYLRSRQDVLKSVYYDKKRQGPSNASDPDAEQAAGSALRETVIFEVGQLPDASADEKQYVQLPKGETVEQRMPATGRSEMLLSRHRFTLLAGTSHYSLVDARGTDFRLLPGQNVVGRHHANDVVVDSAYRDISRKHLIIEPVDEQRVRLTDLSSHGTYIQIDSGQPARDSV